MPPSKRRRRCSGISDDSSKENIHYPDNESDSDETPLERTDIDAQNVDYLDDVHTQRKSFVEKDLLSDSMIVDDDDDLKTPEVECGTIVSLRLINFMCHDKFEIKFGPQINFVIGRNGSGKSAILTAIVLVLGGRSSHTSRGNSFKSFIKTGQTRARITVQLNNFNGINTANSFKYDTYGDHIIIERTLRVEGSSSYSIRSANNRLVSNKKEELDAIVRYFNIQLDNPITILNQEISRNFLNSKNPRDKYSFFMKATLLENIRNDYANALEKSHLTKMELDKKKKVLKEVREELEELEKKVLMLKKLDETGDKVKSLEQELQWAEIEQKKVQFKALEQKIEVRKAKAEEIGLNLESLNEKLANCSKEKDDIIKKLSEMVGNVDEIAKRLEEKREALENVKKKRYQISGEIKQHKNDLYYLEKEKTTLIDKIEKLRQQYGDAETREIEKQKRSQEISELEDELKNIEAEMKTTRVNISQLTNSMISTQEQGMSVSGDIKELDSRIYRKQQDVSNFSQSRSNNVQKFGYFMPELLKNIEQDFKAGKFEHKPIGPIGAHIKLLNADAALAVESCLKNLVTAFCCDNTADAKHLQSIFHRLIRNSRFPTIVTRKFTTRHHVEPHRVYHDRFECFLDLMEIEDERIFNVLVDQIRLETILYFPSHEEAINTMSESSRVPENCLQGFSKDGTNFYPSRGREKVREYASQINSPRYLTGDLESVIRGMEKEISEITRQREEKRKVQSFLKQTLAENKHDKEEADKRLKRLQERQKAIMPRLTELKNIEEPTNLEISVYEDDLKVAMERKNEVQKVFDNLKSEFTKIEDELKELGKDYQALEKQREEQLEQRRPSEEKIQKLDESSKNYERLRDKHQHNLEALNFNISEKEEELRKLQEEINILKEKAMASSQVPIETDRTPETIRKEIAETKSFLQQKSMDPSERKKITKLYRKRSNQHKDTLNQVEAVEDLLREFKRSTKKRLEEYLHHRDRITKKACEVFQIALESSNFAGQLEIYHDECDAKQAKTLEIKINPKKSQHSEVYKDTRSLSGGERSYGTVAFLVALWEACSSPFRILDEVDVFMDVVTRSTAIQILVANAKENWGKQYIFLSPLGLVLDEKFVHVHRMPEPVRGQETDLSDE